MQSLAIEVNGLKGSYVVGMTWRHFDAKPTRAELKEFASTAGAWGLVRSGGANGYQAGACAPLDGIKRSAALKSLADAIAGTLQAPWRGVFDLGEGRYWYVAVAAGYQLLPDGDQVCSLADARALREKHQSFYEHWTESGGDLADLASLTSIAKAGPGLKDFTRGAIPFSPRAVIVGSVATVLVSCGAGGVMLYLQDQETKRLAEQHRKDTAEAVRKEAARKAQEAAEAPPPPWVTTPLPGAVFDACKAAWKGQDLARDGWVLSAWTCMPRGNTLDVGETWTRDGGSAMKAPGQLGPGGETSTSSRQVITTWNGVPQGEVVELLEPDTAIRRGYDLAQRYGLPPDIKPPKKEPTLAGQKPPPPPAYVALNATYKLPFAPWLGFGLAFDELPGLRISKLSLDFKNDEWIADGLIYAKGPGAATGAK